MIIWWQKCGIGNRTNCHIQNWRKPFHTQHAWTNLNLKISEGQTGWVLLQEQGGFRQSFRCFSLSLAVDHLPHIWCYATSTNLAPASWKCKKTCNSKTVWALAPIEKVKVSHHRRPPWPWRPLWPQPRPPSPAAFPSPSTRPWFQPCSREEKNYFLTRDSAGRLKYMPDQPVRGLSVCHYSEQRFTWVHVFPTCPLLAQGPPSIALQFSPSENHLWWILNFWR